MAWLADTQLMSSLKSSGTRRSSGSRPNVNKFLSKYGSGSRPPRRSRKVITSLDDLDDDAGPGTGSHASGGGGMGTSMRARSGGRNPRDYWSRGSDDSPGKDELHVPLGGEDDDPVSGSGDIGLGVSKEESDGEFVEPLDEDPLDQTSTTPSFRVASTFRQKLADKGHLGVARSIGMASSARSGIRESAASTVGSSSARRTSRVADDEEFLGALASELGAEGRGRTSDIAEGDHFEDPENSLEIEIEESRGDGPPAELEISGGGGGADKAEPEIEIEDAVEDDEIEIEDELVVRGGAGGDAGGVEIEEDVLEIEDGSAAPDDTIVSEDLGGGGDSKADGGDVDFAGSVEDGAGQEQDYSINFDEKSREGGDASLSLPASPIAASDAQTRGRTRKTTQSAIPASVDRADDNDDSYADDTFEAPPVAAPGASKQPKAVKRGSIVNKFDSVEEQLKRMRAAETPTLSAVRENPGQRDPGADAEVGPAAAPIAPATAAQQRATTSAQTIGRGNAQTSTEGAAAQAAASTTRLGNPFQGGSAASTASARGGARLRSVNGWVGGLDDPAMPSYGYAAKIAMLESKLREQEARYQLERELAERKHKEQISRLERRIEALSRRLEAKLEAPAPKPTPKPPQQQPQQQPQGPFSYPPPHMYPYPFGYPQPAPGYAVPPPAGIAGVPRVGTAGADIFGQQMLSILRSIENCRSLLQQETSVDLATYAYTQYDRIADGRSDGIEPTGPKAPRPLTMEEAMKIVDRDLAL